MAQQQSIARFFGGTASLDARRKKTLIPPSTQKESTTTPKNFKSSDLNTPPDSSPKLKKQKLKGEENKDDADSKSGSNSDSELNNKHASETEAKKLIELSEFQQRQNKQDRQTLSSLKIPYSSLTDIMEKIESESSRLKITAIISQYFLDILQSQNEVSKLVKIVYLFINRLGPDYEPDLELGLGETLLVKAISEGYGRTPAKIKQDLKEYGDLGIVAQKSRSGQRTMFKPTSLDVDTVFDNLTKIAKSTGKDSQSKKIGIINKMLTACDVKHNEAKFLIRSLENKLRID